MPESDARSVWSKKPSAQTLKEGIVPKECGSGCCDKTDNRLFASYWDGAKRETSTVYSGQRSSEEADRVLVYMPDSGY